MELRNKKMKVKEKRVDKFKERGQRRGIVGKGAKKGEKRGKGRDRIKRKENE